MSEHTRGALKTLSWVGGYLLLFELAVALAAQVPALREHRVLKYLDYGVSIETKIRRMAEDPNLPPNSVFYAGWLHPMGLPPEGKHTDISIYGMSYAGNLGNAIKRADPSIDVRFYGGPGVPLSHSYTAYKQDVARRTARVVIIPLLTGGVYDMLGMTHDTRFADHSQPVTWPRYGFDASGKLTELAYPVIDSPDALRRAVTGLDPELWRRHLDQLEAHDVNFVRWLYTANWTEKSALGRLIRRAQGQAHSRDNAAKIGNGPRLNRDAEAARVLRAMLREYIADVRARGETPFVVLFSEQGKPGQLSSLVRDVIEETGVDYLDSEDFCSATDPTNYRDLHFVPRCDDLMAARVLDFYRALEAPARPPS